MTTTIRMQEKAEQGIWPTKSPLGYRNNVNGIGDEQQCNDQLE
jgi:hypothetical protein